VLPLALPLALARVPVPVYDQSVTDGTTVTFAWVSLGVLRLTTNANAVSLRRAFDAILIPSVASTFVVGDSGAHTHLGERTVLELS
jgi:hypothetical protein